MVQVLVVVFVSTTVTGGHLNYGEFRRERPPRQLSAVLLDGAFTIFSSLYGQRGTEED